MVVGASQHKTINVNMYDLSSQVFAKLSNEQPIKYDWNEKEGMCKSRHEMEKYYELLNSTIHKINRCIPLTRNDSNQIVEIWQRLRLTTM